MRSCWLWAILIANVVSADSLYTPQSPFARLFSDYRAAQVGDVLQVLIMETAQANQTANEQTSNKSDASMGPGLGLLKFIPLIGYGGDIKSAASGTTTHSGSFTSRLAVTVTGIAPNGNLLIEGSREVKLHKDVQMIKLTGEVRPQDVGSDNTVLSYRIAKAQISYTGSNPRRPGSKVGFITGLLHWLF
jgi:flagellar L-ring protein precursor FlgH